MVCLTLPTRKTQQRGHDSLDKYIRLTPLSLDNLPQHPALPGYVEPSYMNHGAPAAKTGGNKNPLGQPQDPDAIEPFPAFEDSMAATPLGDKTNSSENKATAATSAGPEATTAKDDEQSAANNTAPDSPGMRSSHHTSDTLGTSPSGVGRPTLVNFLMAILREASEFMSETVPLTFESQCTKSSPPAKASVHMMKRTIGLERLHEINWEVPGYPRHVNLDNLQPEHWVARMTRHRGAEERGTASFEEFEAGLFHWHSENEYTYTPNVYDAHRVMDWEEAIRFTEMPKEIQAVDMTIYEMCHKLPAGLQPRVFPVLVITFKRTDHLFFTVQLPIHLGDFELGFYSKGANLYTGDEPIKRKRAIIGNYVSVERVYDINGDGTIDWTMATASDAKGVLPMWMQALGVPGAVAKDVGLFMKWAQERRERTE